MSLELILDQFSEALYFFQSIENQPCFLDFIYPKHCFSGYKPDVETIKKNQCEVENNYKELVEMAEKRRKMLEESLKLHTYYQDLAEEGIWLSEKEYFVSSTEYGQDLHNTTLMLQQHNVSLLFGL